MTNYLAVDTETTGLNYWDDLLCVSYASSGGGSEVVNVGFRDLFHQPGALPLERVRFRDAVHKADWVFMHNASFDVPVLIRNGWISQEDLRRKLVDTMSLLSAVRPVDKRDLATALQMYNIRSSSTWFGMKSLRKNLDAYDFTYVASYAREDAELTLKLGQNLLQEARKFYADDWLRREGDFALLVSMMTVWGVPISVGRLANVREQIRKKYKQLWIDLASKHHIEGPNDRTGIINALKREGAVPTEVTGTGKIKVDKNALQGLAPQSKVIRDVLELRRMEKQLSTWVEPMLSHAETDGKAHARWTVGGTKSFRLTCSLPNMLAIPKDFRLFVPGEEYECLLDLDLAQAEARLGGALANEPHFARMFSNGTDFHQATSDLIFPQGKVPGDPHADPRTIAKRANFGAMYGGGWKALQDATGVSEKVARAVVTEHRKTFSKIRSASRSCESMWKKRDGKSPGYLLLQPTKKRIYPSIHDYETGRLYQAFNQLVQGSTAAVMQEVTLDLADEYPNAPTLAQVYDSLLVGVSGEDPRKIADFIERRFNENLHDVLSRTDPPITMLCDWEVIHNEPKEVPSER
jgi:DNA polymerase I-like protein with 3'-5' exonuclease and polymerase domains